MPTSCQRDGLKKLLYKVTGGGESGEMWELNYYTEISFRKVGLNIQLYNLNEQRQKSSFKGTLRKRKWQPTPVLLPGESQGRGSLVGCRLWGHTESDTTEVD